MWGLNISEFYFYCGISVMSGATLLAVLLLIIFKITGKNLKAKLEQDYGNLAKGKVR